MDDINIRDEERRKRNVRIGAAFLVVAVVAALFTALSGDHAPVDPKGLLVDKNQLKETKYFTGVIESVDVGLEGAGVITVHTTVKDITVGDGRYIEPSQMRLIEKSYTVRYTTKTVFDGKGVSDLVVGDRVAVETKEKIYEEDSVTAASIKFFDPREEKITQILGARSILNGVVTEKLDTGNSLQLSVTAEIPDEAQVRAMDLSTSRPIPMVVRVYTITVDGNTTFENGAGRDLLETGTTLSVVTDGDIYQDDAFLAQRIVIIVEDES